MNLERLFCEFEKYLKNKNSKIKKECINFYESKIQEFFDFGMNNYLSKKCIYNVSERQLINYKMYLKDNGENIDYINTKLCILGMFEDFLVDTGRKRKRVFKASILYTKRKRNNEKNINKKTFEIYLRENNPKIKKKSIDFYTSVVKNYLEFAIGEYKIKKNCAFNISKRKLLLYRRMLKHKGYSIKSINTRLNILGVYEKYLVKTGKKEKMVFNSSILYEKKERKNIKNISDESYEEMIEMVENEKNKYCLIFILFSKFKIPTRKIVKIKIKDIDLKNGKICSNEININMTKELKRVLRKYLPERRKILKGYKNEYLFVSHIGKKTGKSMEKTSISMAVKIYFKKLKESENYYGYWSDDY